jgi:hypothetical protein
MEESVMRRAFVSIFALFAVTAAATDLLAFEISIDVAPSVVSLDSNGQVVTVHTDIAYSAVDAYTVALDGLAIQSWKSDHRGNFVAKFNLDDVKEMVEVGTVTLTLMGATKDGEPFSGVDTIRVIKPRNLR